MPPPELRTTTSPTSRGGFAFPSRPRSAATTVHKRHEPNIFSPFTTDRKRFETIEAYLPESPKKPVVTRPKSKIGASQRTFYRHLEFQKQILEAETKHTPFMSQPAFRIHTNPILSPRVTGFQPNQSTNDYQRILTLIRTGKFKDLYQARAYGPSDEGIEGEEYNEQRAAEHQSIHMIDASKNPKLQPKKSQSTAQLSATKQTKAATTRLVNFTEVQREYRNNNYKFFQPTSGIKDRPHSGYWKSLKNLDPDTKIEGHGLSNFLIVNSK